MFSLDCLEAKLMINLLFQSKLVTPYFKRYGCPINDKSSIINGQLSDLNINITIYLYNKILFGKMSY